MKTSQSPFNYSHCMLCKVKAGAILEPVHGSSEPVADLTRQQHAESGDYEGQVASRHDKTPLNEPSKSAFWMSGLSQPRRGWLIHIFYQQSSTFELDGSCLASAKSNISAFSSAEFGSCICACITFDNDKEPISLLFEWCSWSLSKAETACLCLDARPESG